MQKARLAAFQRRSPKFRKLVKMGIKTDRVIRTGGLSAMIFGQATTGVSNTTRLRQRRVVGAVTAPSSGSGGQDLGVALMLADGSAKGKAGPVFPARTMSIRAWAEAVWVRRLPFGSLKRMVEFAKNRLRNAKRQWSIC